jgi:hypothetical protein
MILFGSVLLITLYNSEIAEIAEMQQALKLFGCRSVCGKAMLFREASKWHCGSAAGLGTKASSPV